ncbi:MAG TPA: hypothetical protein VGH36_11945 [Acetobacteraceae bacterium]
MILNRRNLLASIGLALPALAVSVVGAQAATGLKKKPTHLTKVSAKKMIKPTTTKVSATKSHHAPKTHVAVQG